MNDLLRIFHSFVTLTLQNGYGIFKQQRAESIISPVDTLSACFFILELVITNQKEGGDIHTKAMDVDMYFGRKSGYFVCAVTVYRCH